MLITDDLNIVFAADQLKSVRLHPAGVGSVIGLSTYSLRVLRNDKELNLYRGSREHDDSQILVLSPAMEYTAPETLKRLEHEYSLREELDPAWAARRSAFG